MFFFKEAVPLQATPWLFSKDPPVIQIYLVYYRSPQVNPTIMQSVS